MSEEKPRVGIGVMILKDWKVLMSLRKGSHGEGEWQFPGGHLEFGESFERCAVREVKEETDIEIENVRFQFLANVKKYANKHYVHIGLIADYKSGKVKNTEPEKSGVRYYRLKIVDLDNSFEYTRVKPVTFNNDVKWHVYPNPSKGIFNFVYQLGNGENIRAQLHDASGKQVHLINLTGNGFLQKTVIDLRSPKYASGIYLLNTIGGDKTQSLKLIKH